MRFLYSFLFLGALFFVPQYISAQAMPAQDSFSIGIVPSYPRPFDTVTIVPQSTNIDLSGGLITTKVNGVVVGETTGKQPLQATVGDAGTKTTITMTVVISGTTYTQTKVIYPASVALVMEPVTTTHPLYRGAALVAPEGRVRLIAVPYIKGTNGKQLPSQGLIYTWRQGSKILESESGIGRSILTASAPVRYRDAEITLTVTNQENTLVAQETVTVAAGRPLVHIYRNDPLLGPDFGTALTNTFSMPDEEETFRAVGYYFKDMPSFSWSVNDAVSGSEPDVTVRQTGQGSGTASLGVLLKGDKGESAGNGLSVLFGASTSRGLFDF